MQVQTRPVFAETRSQLNISIGIELSNSLLLHEVTADRFVSPDHACHSELNS